MAIKAKILLIDDDEDFRISITKLLESNQYEVHEADSGKSGLAKMKSVKPDLIILDIMMETMDEGYSVNHIIKFQQEYSESSKIPIIMVSSIQQDPLTRFPHADGQVEMIIPEQYMTKPVDIPKFLNLVDKLLKK